MKLVACVLLASCVFAPFAGASRNSGSGACGQSHVGASPVPSFHDGRFIVDSVRVGGLAPACAGRTVEVVLTGARGTLLRVNGVAPKQGGTLRLLTSRDVSASAVSGVSVAIGG